MSSKTFPSLDLERELVANFGCRFVVGVDEVGRGAIAGPVCVGVAVVDFAGEVAPWPKDLRDSKLLSEPKREAVAPLTAEWVTGWAVGEASVAEIEQHGITRSLAIAAKSALGQLNIDGLTRSNTVLLLDGKHNWLAPVSGGVRTVTQIKADQTSAVVAAASVLAKVHRDGLLRAADERYPGFALAQNKGYAASNQIERLRQVGPTDYHRISWLTKILEPEATDTI